MPVIPVDGVGNVEYPDGWDASKIRVHAAGLGAKARAAIAGQATGAGAPPAAPIGGPQAALGGPRTPFQQQAAGRLANNIQAQGVEQQAQGNADAGADAVKTMALAIPTLATGGLGLAGAAVGGLAYGLIKQTANADNLTSDQPKSVKELALSLGADTGLNMAGYGLAKGVASVGKTLLPKLLVQSAAKSEAGAALLKDASATTNRALYSEIENAGNTKVNVGKPLARAYSALNNLPSPKGELARFGGLTPKAQEALAAIEDGMDIQAGSISPTQPLAGIIRAKGSIQQFAYGESGLSNDEAAIFKRLAQELDGHIKGALPSSDAQALYAKGSDLYKLEMRKTGAQNLANVIVSRSIGAAIGGTVGSGAGSYSGHRAIGGGVGAAAGAAFAPQLSTLVLQQVMSHPGAAGVYHKAVDLFLNDQKGPAMIAAARAFSMAGADQTIEQAGKTLKTDPPPKISDAVGLPPQ